MGLYLSYLWDYYFSYYSEVAKEDADILWIGGIADDI